jgi:hypothetical protein
MAGRSGPVGGFPSRSCDGGGVGNCLDRRLHIGEVDDRELEAVLGHCFPHARSTEHPGTIVHCNSAEEVAIVVRYAREGRIDSIEAGPALDASTLNDLVSLVETELLNRRDTYTKRDVLFAALPVTGYLRHGDDWQILPVPECAPRPRMLMAPHPFLVELCITHTSLPFLAMRREWQRLGDLHAVLSLLLHGGVERRDFGWRHRWTMVSLRDGMPPETVLADDGYCHDGYEPSGEGFSLVNDVSKLTLVDDVAYFSQRGLSTGEVL